jgi:hypothetical protein
MKPSEELLDAMLEKIGQLIKTKEWQAEGGRYIPYPATWLNSQGWLDEVPELGGNNKDAKESWNEVLLGLKKYGCQAYKQEYNEKIKKAVKSIGGWSELANLTEFNLQRKKTEFFESFNKP